MAKTYSRDEFVARVADVLARAGVEDAGELTAELERRCPTVPKPKQREGFFITLQAGEKIVAGQPVVMDEETGLVRPLDISEGVTGEPRAYGFADNDAAQGEDVEVQLTGRIHR